MDIPGWWGVSSSWLVGGKFIYPTLCTHISYVVETIRYPTLKWIACDYLAIQGSTTPSEHAFSSEGLTGVSHRSRLQPAIFEGLQILKSAY